MHLHSVAMAATLPPKSTGSTKLDAVIQKAAASEPQKLSGVALYSRFVSALSRLENLLADKSQAFAGAVCCAVTHGGLTPVDV